MLKHDIQINLRVNAEEQELLHTNAKKCGLSAAKYLRSLIHGYVPKEQPSVDYKKMIRELHAIGNSMNQIAARANATGFFLKDRYRAISAYRRSHGKDFGHCTSSISVNCGKQGTIQNNPIRSC